MSFFTNRRQTESDDANTDSAQEKSAHIGFDTVLSATTHLDGTLKSEGNIRLDGEFTGKLDISGNVLVGETAQINADIEARNISIAGQVRGNVTGNKVQLLRTGRIWGDIKAQSLTTEEGAFIEGNIAMYNTSPIIEDIEPDEETSVTSDVYGEDDTDIPAIEEPETATIPSRERIVLDDDAADNELDEE